MPSFFLQPLQLDLHGVAQLGVECGERLVEQQHLRLADDGPRERHALPLAAGKLDGLARFHPAERHERHNVFHALGNFELRHFLHAQAEADVFLDREMREKRVALKDLVHVAPVGREVGHVRAVEPDGAFGRRFKTGDHPQQRRLSAARRAEQREKLARLNGEIDVGDGGKSAEAFRDVAKFDHERESESH